jgi:hypothetical protein
MSDGNTAETQQEPNSSEVSALAERVSAGEFFSMPLAAAVSVAHMLTEQGNLMMRI